MGFTNPVLLYASEDAGLIGDYELVLKSRQIDCELKVDTCRGTVFTSVYVDYSRYAESKKQLEQYAAENNFKPRFDDRLYSFVDSVLLSLFYSMVVGLFFIATAAGSL